MNESRFELFSMLIESSLKSITRLKQIFMETYNLSATHARCLTALLSNSPMNQNQLAEKLGIDRSQISRILKDLLDRGFVISDNNNPYKKNYRLTDKGHSSAQILFDTILKINNYVSDDIPEEDIRIFYKTLEQINTGLKQATRQFATPEQMLSHSGTRDKPKDSLSPKEQYISSFQDLLPPESPES